MPIKVRCALLLLLGLSNSSAIAAEALPFDIGQFIVQQARRGHWGLAEFGKNPQTNAIDVMMHFDGDQKSAGTAYFTVAGRWYASRCERLVSGKWLCTEGAPLGRNAFLLDSK